MKISKKKSKNTIKIKSIKKNKKYGGENNYKKMIDILSNKNYLELFNYLEKEVKLNNRINKKLINKSLNLLNKSENSKYNISKEEYNYIISSINKNKNKKISNLLNEFKNITNYNQFGGLIIPPNYISIGTGTGLGVLVILLSIILLLPDNKNIYRKPYDLTQWNGESIMV